MMPLRELQSCIARMPHEVWVCDHLYLQLCVYRYRYVYLYARSVRSVFKCGHARVTACPGQMGLPGSHSGSSVATASEQAGRLS